MSPPDLIKTFVSIIVITNPFAALPIFLSLTKNQDSSSQRKQALITGIAVLSVLLISTWIGLPLLNFFGIHVPAFSIAGGIIILLMGLAMLHEDHTNIQHTDKDQLTAQQKDSVAVVPMAIPILAGPGAISTVIHLSHEASTVTNRLSLSLVLTTAALTLTSVLFFADRIGSLLGESSLKIITKIMGMILAAIAIEMITGGALKIFPGLAGS